MSLAAGIVTEHCSAAFVFGQGRMAVLTPSGLVGFLPVATFAAAPTASVAAAREADRAENPTAAVTAFLRE